EVLHHEVVVVERDVEGVLHERDELLESQRVEYACRQRIAGDGMVGQLLHVALDPAGGVHALAPSATARAIHLVVRSTVSSCDRSVGLRWIVVSSTISIAAPRAVSSWRRLRNSATLASPSPVIVHSGARSASSTSSSGVRSNSPLDPNSGRAARPYRTRFHARIGDVRTFDARTCARE